MGYSGGINIKQEDDGSVTTELLNGTTGIPRRLNIYSYRVAGTQELCLRLAILKNSKVESDIVLNKIEIKILLNKIFEVL